MAKPDHIQFAGCDPIPIVFEDRAAMVIDKPAGWMLVPDQWQQTSRNLQAALVSSIRGGDFWAKSRNLKYLRFVHRLDADTTGLLLLAKSPRALAAFSRLFREQAVRKTYLAVIASEIRRPNWVCDLRLDQDLKDPRKMRVATNGVPAKTSFRLLAAGGGRSLLEAEPLTGRTHQIRVHLAARGHPVVGDPIYGAGARDGLPLALRAVRLRYVEPFTGRPLDIRAPWEGFVRRYGFDPGQVATTIQLEPRAKREG